MSNRRKKNALAGLLLLVASASIAQNYVDDALTFGQTKLGGSARIQAIGGAQIALGGDYSSALSNPAGLGMYNRSEFTFTPAVSGYSSKASYFGSSDKNGKTIFNIPGISIVFHGSKEKKGFLGGSFGISMSRINDFQGATTFHGRNDYNSIIDSYIDQANGSTTIQFDDRDGWNYNTPTGLAYFNYLIGPQSTLDPSLPDDQYFTDAPVNSDQQCYIDTKGRTNQWNISYGGNYKDIFFFGGGIGITSLKYTAQRIFEESFPIDSVIFGHSLTENIETKGAGINATVGFIVRPADFLQIGASFISPTVYNVSSTYDASMSSDWNNFDYFQTGKPEDFLRQESSSTDYVVSDYSLTTPFKFSGGVALISKFGFITGDIELTNPAQTKYSSNNPDVSFSQENSDIKNVYKSTVNYRIGAEYRYKVYRVRGGYGVQGSSYQKELNIDGSITNISGGVGIRTSNYFVDLALINSQKKYYYQPYSLANSRGPAAEIKKNVFTAMITVGFTF